MPDLQVAIVREGSAVDEHRGSSDRGASAAGVSADVAPAFCRNGSAVERQDRIAAHVRKVSDDELIRGNVHVGNSEMSFTTAADTDPVRADDLAAADRVADRLTGRLADIEPWVASAGKAEYSACLINDHTAAQCVVVSGDDAGPAGVIDGHPANVHSTGRDCPGIDIHRIAGSRSAGRSRPVHEPI